MNYPDGAQDTWSQQTSAKVQDTLKPLRRLNKFFVLNYCTESKTRWQNAWTVAKAMACALILGFLNFYTLSVKMRDVYDAINMSIKLTDAVQMCYDYCQYIVDLIFVHNVGNGISLAYYARYAQVDQILGITVYTSIKSRLVKLIVYFTVVWLISSTTDFIAWSLSYGAYIPTLYSIGYIFFLIKILNSLDLTSHVMHIEFRLRSIKEHLQECYCSTKPLTANFDGAVWNDNWFCCENNWRFSKTNIVHPEQTIVERNNQQVLKWLSRCYLNLLEQCVLINKMYGIRILLNCLSLLIDMIRFTNIAVRLIIGSQATRYDSGFFPAVANLLRMMTCALVVGSLVAHCERAYRQADATLAVIDQTLVNKDPDDDVRATLTELRGLMQSRRVDFHMAFFFRLDYSLLVSIASVVVTYTIILVQSLPN